LKLVKAPKLQERASLFVGGRVAAENRINVSANVGPICSPAHDSPTILCVRHRTDRAPPGA